MPTPNNGRIPETSDRSTARETGTSYVVTHDPDGPSKLSTTLIHALADVMHADVSGTQVALCETIDPDALDHLFQSTDDDGETGSHVGFTVDAYRVTVYEDGRIVITPP